MPRLGGFPHRELAHILFSEGGGLLVEDEGSNVKGNEVSEVSGVNRAGKDKPAAEELVLLVYSCGSCHHPDGQQHE